ncbi:MAG TPA: 1-(5-phosphoribosyl)-5-[(5-phosphoribosylamino)methylideneamino]imidazole-4-carboxamide isomerase [Solirubrobacteraceae bacterium]|jgi:phosphoribosylformimino-5-aminoimidazole carboxamide ribotide isomerase|nr:1-(5-phosphoribosyl)-5-[(5-phosphoribosylamino)methylideneamino]imidazole-4-carboxamide isomerase [Solirubrobacteraceae bacterium]
MNLYPAIDILDGHAVRLVKGDFDARTVYDEDPLEAARGWVQAGARHLHVIDLDGARGGTPVNLAHLQRIVTELGTPVQYGGGLRSLEAVDAAVNAGATGVILGTAAFRDPDFLAAALQAHGERVQVGVDVRGGRLTTAGWTETSQESTEEVLARLAEHGVRRIIYTDVDRDGMLRGPDLDQFRRVAQMVQGELQYSGGIGSLADLHALVALQEPNVTGVVVGKALFERRFTVAEALAALER